MSSASRFSVEVTTPLGKDAFTFRELWGEESVSGLFRFDVEMDSNDSAVDFKKLVGKDLTVTCTLPGGKKRHYHGIVSRIVQGDSDARATRYRAEVRPKMWLLSLQSDCRIFQDKTVPEIVQEVLKSVGFTDVTLSLSKTHAAREYCVQYRENSLDFVSRLMEDAGIFYYFKHEAAKHVLVLGDDTDAHIDCPAGSEARVRLAHSDAARVDEVWNCSFEQRVTVESYSVDDYNFETPSTALLGKEGSDPLKLHEFPGGVTKKDEATALAKTRLEAVQADGELLHGDGATLSFTAGHLFTLKDHPRTSANTGWILRSVQHRITASRGKISFTAQPKSVVFRPVRQTPRPVIAGAQTAVVTGKSGEEIWTDKYGRIRVQFHWDQLGKKDEKSSCWVRVSHGWAGKGWGAFFLPRIGQEVVVSFLEGDPDRPLVTGSVYNAEQVVPYTLPGEQSKSTVKSQSTKDGGEGFNELRFEDKKDAEEIFLHAQKDLNIEVLNDQTSTIKTNRKTTVEEGDDTLEVLKGKRTIKVKGDEAHTNEANVTLDVTKNYTLKVKGNLTIEAEGTVTFKSGKAFTIDSGAGLKVSAAQAIASKAGTALTNEAGTELTNKSGTALTNKAGTSLTNDAGVSLTSKAGASQKVEASGVLEVKGAMVKIN
jgi:type VI secretion system secreted protein VgrG